MFIELVDTLRCPAPHEDSWLVATVDRYHGRYIAEGALGCPICRAQYPVRSGAVHFGDVVASHGHATPVGEDDVERAQALLGLAEPGGRVVLAGAAAVLVHALEEASGTAMLLVNPRGVEATPGLSVLWCRDLVPLAPASLRGVIVGDDVSSALLPSLVRALAPRGRLVAPAVTPVPMDVRELARDDREWVAERTGSSTSAPVGLRRR
ncbi:MAG: hypothetical protein JNL26_17920 [Gemmatimonadetes bacterium]|nr:hypothetical protein [Gemmatimonadota bacterium]